MHHPHIAGALGRLRAALAPRVSATDTHGPLRGARIMVAWSAGPDSAALLGLLALASHGDGFSLCVGHVDHGLRAAAAAEADLVVRAAQARGLAVKVARLRLAPGPGLAARARAARYEALSMLAHEFQAPYVALGHTATDQTETMLMHLVRGAGLEGLAAMSEVEVVPGYVRLRPLLMLNREETREVATLLRIPFVDDPTNGDRDHWRVRIRTEILPQLRAENPRVEQAFAAAARQSRDAEDALQSWACAEMKVRARPVGECGEQIARWSVEGLQHLPRAVRTRWLRHACAHAGVELEALGHRVTEAVDAAIVAGAGKKRGCRTHAWDVHPLRRITVEGTDLRIDWAHQPRSKHEIPAENLDSSNH